MKNQLKAVWVLMSGSLLFVGCQTPQSAPRQTTQIECTIPKIEVIADSINKQTQSKGGLDITVVPALYKGVRADKINIRRVEPTLGESVTLGLGGGLQNKVFVEQTTVPQLKADPNRLSFVIKIHNQLNRVFHGQGAVVQFNVDGKLIPFNNTDYKEFSGGIVPPLNDADLAIQGPPLDALKEKGTITIFLYDVVTATDAAGNTTEKQNYTWDFTYTMQTVTDNAVFETKRGLIDIYQYQRLMMQEQKQQTQQLQGQVQ